MLLNILLLVLVVGLAVVVAAQRVDAAKQAAKASYERERANARFFALADAMDALRMKIQSRRKAGHVQMAAWCEHLLELSSLTHAGVVITDEYDKLVEVEE